MGDLSRYLKWKEEVIRGERAAFWVNKFGRNADVDTGAAGEDITGIGGIYAPPTQPRIHNIASTSEQDKGTLLSSGLLTSASFTKIIDEEATFISDGAQAHDIILNDNSQDHSLVESVDSETQMTVHRMHHGIINNIGDSYRVVGRAGTGAAVSHIKQGLLDGFIRNTEFMINNGNTDVATLNEYSRIDRFHIHGVGSNKTNVGDITATPVVDNSVTAKVLAGRGQTEMVYYSIPDGFVGFVHRVYADMNRKTDTTADITIYQRLWGDTHGVGGDGELVFGAYGISRTKSLDKEFGDFPMEISTYSDFWMRGEVAANDTDISGGFDIELIATKKINPNNR